jgi:hypothetical protein
MMEAVCASETSVNIYLTTHQYILEDYKLHTRRRENLKSHIDLKLLYFCETKMFYNSVEF